MPIMTIDLGYRFSSHTISANLTLTNPISSTYNINATAGSLKVILPPMNAAGSLRKGRDIIIANIGTFAIDLYYTDGTTFIATIAAGTIYQVALTDNSTSNGVVFSYGIRDTGSTLLGYHETLTTANSGAAYSVDLNGSNNFFITLTASCTFSFINASASSAHGFTMGVKQDSTGGRVTTWPASVDWSQGIIPSSTTTANARDVFTFFTTDGGTTWNGFQAGVDMS